MRIGTCFRLASLAGVAAGLAFSATASAQYTITNSIPGTFTDITAIGGAPLTGDDQSYPVIVSAARANPAFPAGTMGACTNGHVGYGVDTQYANFTIPSGFFYGGATAAAVYFDDLITHTATAGVYQAEVTEGVVPVLIIQWTDMDHYFTSTSTGTLEIKIFGGAGPGGAGPGGAFAQFLYQDVDFGDPAFYDNGISATIGYQSSGTLGTQFSFNTASIQNGTVLSLILDATGACCLSDGSCTSIAHSLCTAQAGVYRGDGVSCVGANCPQPGACCIASNNTCAVMQNAACLAAGGTYRGDNTNCAAACPGAASCYIATVNVPILDSPAAQLPGPDADATLVIPQSGTITSLSARALVSHTFQGDMRVRLVHPDGTSAILLGRPGVAPPKYDGTAVGFGFGTDNMGNPATGVIMEFVDSAANGVYDDAIGHPGPPAGTAAPVNNPVGQWQADGLLGEVFGGKDINGTWHLIVNDFFPADVGTIRSFGICVTVQGTTSACYANCDSSTILPCLNVQDFTCFLNRFASGATYANCDGSTIVPVLNVQDFTCFLNRFASGCSNC